MYTRYVSVQVLLNKDLSLKAQRVYAIPKPAVVSFYLQAIQVGSSGANEPVIVGVLVQNWTTLDILDDHPNMGILLQTLKKHFGINWGWKK